MNEATMTEPATVNPASAGIRTGRDAPGVGSAPVNGVPIDESLADQPPTNGASVNGVLLDKLPTGKLADTDLAVPLTEEEWAEQPKLFEEYSEAIAQQDRKREAEILPKLIWPAWILKAEKKLMGANHIRKEGLNTVDADLVYGPGWLDEDDGGPTCPYSPDYKPLGPRELPRSWRDRS